MKHFEAWMFRRLVGCGALPANIPIYTFSPAANEYLHRINDEADPVALDEMTPRPHDCFAVEMDCSAKPDRAVVIRSLSVVMPVDVGMMPVQSGAGATWERVSHVVLEFRNHGGMMWLVPPLLLREEGYGFVAPWGPDRDECMTMINEWVRRINEAFELVTAKLPPHQRLLLTPPTLGPEQYAKFGKETVAFLRCACAVIGSRSFSHTVEERALKFGRRTDKAVDARTLWTHLDIDVDREGAGGGVSVEPRHGVALHKVRSHIRLTRNGVTVVREHTRGDARFGVRHRRATVHRGKV